MTPSKKSGAATPAPEGGAPTLDNLPPDPGIVSQPPAASEPNVTETTVTKLLDLLHTFPGLTPVAITGSLLVGGVDVTEEVESPDVD